MMGSCTVILVDVTSAMSSPLPYDTTRSSKKENGPSKFHFTMQSIKFLCKFLALHLPWENVELYLFSRSFRQARGFCDPVEMYCFLLSEPNGLEWKGLLTSPPDSSYYPSMLAAAYTAVKSLARNCTVLIFADGSFNPASFETLKTFPQHFVCDNFLPLPNNSPVFFVQFSSKYNNPFINYLYETNRSRGRGFVISTEDPIDVAMEIFSKLYNPWCGKLEVNSADGRNLVEEVCLFPNPWGIRGLLNDRPAPEFLRFNEGDSEFFPTGLPGSSVVLPKNVLPTLWNRFAKSEWKKLWRLWNILEETRSVYLDLESVSPYFYSLSQRNYRATESYGFCTNTKTGSAYLRVLKDENVLKTAGKDVHELEQLGIKNYTENKWIFDYQMLLFYSRQLDFEQSAEKLVLSMATSWNVNTFIVIQQEKRNPQSTRTPRRIKLAFPTTQKRPVSRCTSSDQIINNKVRRRNNSAGKSPVKNAAIPKEPQEMPTGKTRKVLGGEKVVIEEGAFRQLNDRQAEYSFFIKGLRASMTENDLRDEFFLAGLTGLEAVQIVRPAAILNASYSCARVTIGHSQVHYFLSSAFWEKLPEPATWRKYLVQPWLASQNEKSARLENSSPISRDYSTRRPNNWLNDRRRKNRRTFHGL